MSNNIIHQSSLFGNSVIGSSSVFNSFNGITNLNVPHSLQGKLIISGVDADIVINERSLKTILASIEQRLCILSPNPEMHKKYAALKNAYDHYKMLEALCFNQDDTI